jgi:hypothetical protein
MLSSEGKAKALLVFYINLFYLMDLAIHTTITESSPYADPLSQIHEWVQNIDNHKQI